MHHLYLMTDRFLLRPFRPTDARPIWKNIRDPQIYENTLSIPRPYRQKHATEHIAKNLRQYRMKKPANLGFVIEVNREAVGAIGVTFRGTTAEIGYWLARKHWGQGMMTEIIGLFTDYLFTKYHLRRITARVFTFNTASARVLEKNSFRKVRRLVRGEKKNGEWMSIFEYAKKAPRRTV